MGVWADAYIRPQVDASIDPYKVSTDVTLSRTL